MDSFKINANHPVSIPAVSMSDVSRFVLCTTILESLPSGIPIFFTMGIYEFALGSTSVSQILQ
jgi:hypothetical protein